MSASARAVLGGILVALVAAAVAAGLLFVGSPETARQQKLDERRVRDLTAIASSIDSYWKTNARLPASLEEAARGGRTAVPRDPVGNEIYAYRTVDETHYEVCATFDLAAGTPPAMDQLPFWSHTAGRQCFTVEVRVN